MKKMSQILHYNTGPVRKLFCVYISTCCDLFLDKNSQVIIAIDAIINMVNTIPT